MQEENWERRKLEGRRNIEDKDEDKRRRALRGEAA